MSKTYTVQKEEKDLISPKFDLIGARVKVRKPRLNRHGNVIWRERFAKDSDFKVDVRRDRKGEYFDIVIADDNNDIKIDVLNVDKDIKHLLLMVKNGRDNTKILCGHDEREWFTAQVKTSSTTIRGAMDALKPKEVLNAQKKAGVKTKKWNCRHNEGFIRQGEWFFVKKDIEVNEDAILKNEPLILSGVRAGNKPHIAQFAYRTGGEQVYIPSIGASRLSDYPRDWVNRLGRGLTGPERRLFLDTFGKASKIKWRTMSRNPDLYVSGTVRHPDHKTINLTGWYRVYVNGEIRGENVVFLD